MLNFNQLQGLNCRTYKSGIVSPHSSWIFLRSVSFAPILRRKSPQGQKNKTASPTDSMYGRFHGKCMQIYSSSNTSYGPLESLQKCCNKKLWITFSCIYWNFATFSYFELFFPTCLTATLVSAPWVIIWYIVTNDDATQIRDWPCCPQWTFSRPRGSIGLVTRCCLWGPHRTLMARFRPKPKLANSYISAESSLFDYKNKRGIMLNCQPTLLAL